MGNVQCQDKKHHRRSRKRGGGLEFLQNANDALKQKQDELLKQANDKKNEVAANLDEKKKNLFSGMAAKINAFAGGKKRRTAKRSGSKHRSTKRSGSKHRSTKRSSTKRH
jgi:hypothetical protein